MCRFPFYRIALAVANDFVLQLVGLDSQNNLTRIPIHQLCRCLNSPLISRCLQNRSSFGSSIVDMQNPGHLEMHLRQHRGPHPYLLLSHHLDPDPLHLQRRCHRYHPFRQCHRDPLHQDRLHQRHLVHLLDSGHRHRQRIAAHPPRLPH